MTNVEVQVYAVPVLYRLNELVDSYDMERKYWIRERGQSKDARDLYLDGKIDIAAVVIRDLSLLIKELNEA